MTCAIKGALEAPLPPASVVCRRAISLSMQCRCVMGQRRGHVRVDAGDGHELQHHVVGPLGNIEGDLAPEGRLQRRERSCGL
ncbi:MAG TPA: hypothetical protein VIG52_00805 [Methyloceanibacter sp.]